MNKYNKNLFIHKVDSSNYIEVKDYFLDLKKNITSIDSLINNVGISGPTGKLEDLKIEDWLKTLDVNINSHFYFIKSAIPFLKKRYNCIIGYSGHEYNLEPSIVAITLGAEIIERHITLDHNMWGTDQSSSLEIDGMNKLYNRAKDIKKIIGEPKKRITESEVSVRKKLRG